jgi:hypothetical protein
VTCQATRCDSAPATAAASSGRHRYRAFGLTIASAVPLPQLALAEPDIAADVAIVLGKVEGPRISRPGFRRWEIHGEFRYEVDAGRHIVVDRLPGSRDENVSDLIMARVLTAAAYQRGLLPLHGSAVATAGGIVALCGPSGAGKSTLAGVLAARGGEVVADDMIALGDGSEVMGRGAAGLKLSVPALAKLGRTPEGLMLANSVERKFFLPASGAPQRSARIAALAQLKSGEFAVEPLSPVAACAGWKACIRMPELLPEAPDPPALWRRWLDLVLATANWSVAHGGRMDTLERIAARLEQAPQAHVH